MILCYLGSLTGHTLIPCFVFHPPILSIPYRDLFTLREQRNLEIQIMPRNCAACNGKIQRSRTFPAKNLPEYRAEWISRLGLSLAETEALRVKLEREDAPLLWCEKHFVSNEDLPADVGITSVISNCLPYAEENCRRSFHAREDCCPLSLQPFGSSHKANGIVPVILSEGNEKSATKDR